VRVVYSPLHARQDGGVELHCGALVPSFESPLRAQFILEALQQGGFEIVPPRDMPEARLQGVHDAQFIEFLQSAHARWTAGGREGSMLPSGFPARGLRQDHRPSGINGAMGWYTFDASTPIVAGTWDAALDVARYAPDALVVSLGVDTFEADPISGFRLTGGDYARLGDRLAGAALPTVLVQEGGYAVAEIGANVAGVLAAFADRTL
jgi:acetoin utilization deacetylase AcuC-like enzyme